MRGVSSLWVSFLAMARALGPLTRTIAIDPTPRAVAMAAIVSFFSKLIDDDIFLFVALAHGYVFIGKGLA